MPSTIVAVSHGKRELDLIDQWIRSTGQKEIGLLDLVVLDEWITQTAPEGGSGSSE